MNANFANGAEVLRSALDIVKDKIKEGVIEFNSNHIQIQSMDDNHVALVNLVVDVDTAMTYICDDVYRLNVSFVEFVKILKTIPKSAMCSLMFKRDKPDKLRITYKNGKIKGEYSLKLQPTNPDWVPSSLPPEDSYATSIQLEVSDFKSILGNLQSFGQDVLIKRHDSLLSFQSCGETVDTSLDIELEEGEDEDVEGRYSLEYLNWFAKSSGISDSVTMRMDMSIPLMLEFSSDICNFKFFLAAKMND